MADPFPDHYATLGLDRGCTLSQIRAAYRALAAKFHPDRNRDSAAALHKMQQLNEAHETLTDPVRRQIYHRDLDDHQARERPRTRSRNSVVRQDVHIPIRAFFRGISLEVRVNDPGNADGAEVYQVDVPAGTAPGARFQVPRTGAAGGNVQVRVKARPDPRFKARGSDLRCDLRISLDRATKGGTERIPGPNDRMIVVTVPPRVPRGEIIRVAGEGLPKAHGGRGDLFVRIVYRPSIRVSPRARRF